MVKKRIRRNNKLSLEIKVSFIFTKEIYLLNYKITKNDNEC